ncbi:hypothetical protein IHE44_0005047 [Lamprotornis superbus]|uniref:Uncharacterized protein n=1 Tax=Lamprotornis superbus TaxID=245042 RepID=A0A835TZX8_9PASS|nr:hypothetical protein IHE44_0005047 [Lamprotornis superbus]
MDNKTPHTKDLLVMPSNARAGSSSTPYTNMNHPACQELGLAWLKVPAAPVLSLAMPHHNCADTFSLCLGCLCSRGLPWEQGTVVGGSAAHGFHKCQAPQAREREWLSGGMISSLQGQEEVPFTPSFCSCFPLLSCSLPTPAIPCLWKITSFFRSPHLKEKQLENVADDNHRKTKLAFISRGFLRCYYTVVPDVTSVLSPAECKSGYPCDTEKSDCPPKDTAHNLCLNEGGDAAQAGPRCCCASVKQKANGTLLMLVSHCSSVCVPYGNLKPVGLSIWGCKKEYLMFVLCACVCQRKCVFPTLRTCWFGEDCRGENIHHAKMLYEQRNANYQMYKKCEFCFDRDSGNVEWVFIPSLFYAAVTLPELLGEVQDAVSCLSCGSLPGNKGRGDVAMAKDVPITEVFELKVFNPGEKRKWVTPLSPVLLLRDLQIEKKIIKVVSRTSIFFAKVVINILH